jgi:hypothetical protein
MAVSTSTDRFGARPGGSVPPTPAPGGPALAIGMLVNDADELMRRPA